MSYIINANSCIDTDRDSYPASDPATDTAYAETSALPWCFDVL